jgi:uncharacterized alpha-E superfamily protein
MLSRVADNLYWMSRHLERAEHILRLLDVNMGLMLDRTSTTAEGRWQRVIAAVGRPAGVTWTGDFQELANTLVFDIDNPSSVTSCIIAARDNARQVRDEISTEQWQQLNRIYHRVTEPRVKGDSYVSLSTFLPLVMDGVHLFQGITDTTMNHGEGWQFIQIGRYLERASATAMLLDLHQSETFSVHEDPSDGYQYLEWIGLLRSCTAFEAYCKVYTADLTHSRILEFLLLNREFPHSVRFSVDCLNQALHAIQSGRVSQPSDELMRISGRLQASLNFMDISEILSRDPTAYLRRIQQQCHQVHDLIYKFYILYSVQAALAL